MPIFYFYFFRWPRWTASHLWQKDSTLHKKAELIFTTLLLCCFTFLTTTYILLMGKC